MSPDGFYLATASSDKTVNFIDMRYFEVVKTMNNIHTGN